MKALLVALSAALAGLLALQTSSAAFPAGLDPGMGRVDVELELPKDVPYTGEMILMRVRAAIHGIVVIDELHQPSLTNFSWQQLGRDKVIHMTVDGFDVPGIERDIAIFPQQPGRLIIEPFVRHVTLVVDENRRIEADFESKPVYIDVQRHEGLGHAGDWWLPASGVTYHDTWDPEPDEIAQGQITHRTLSIEAIGVTADRLPPPPLMRAPGIIAFTGPVKRETILTATGPIARAVYQWDVKPATNSPANLPAIVIPWFDTKDRRMRNATIPHHWVSYAGISAGLRSKLTASLGAQLLTKGPLIAGGVGFLWALSLAYLVLSQQNPWTALRNVRAIASLRRAGRRNDPTGVKAALSALATGDPARWQTVAQDTALAPRLAQLDASLYASSASPPPPLGPLARDLRAAWRSTASRPAPDPLTLKLDGPRDIPAEPRSWIDFLPLSRAHLTLRRKRGMR